MYLEHYKIETKPFQITADPKFLWLGEKHKEALATLRYGILDNRGFLLLTGEVGTGKTLLINRLITMLDMDTAVATLPDPDLTSMDFYNILADGLKMNRTFDSKGAFLIHLRDFLHQSYAENKQVLLVIDESQRLNHRLMEDIRVLSNIELHDRKLINIFFVGQQEFNTILSAPQNRALAQRITVRYHILPLDQNELGQYITHRLSVAGTTRKLFDTSAIKEIYQFSGGIPRLINILCDHALLTGYARNTHTIDAGIIKECAQELRIPIKSGIKGVVATVQGADSKSIADAASKQAGEAAKGPLLETSTDSIGSTGTAGTTDVKPADEVHGRSPLWKLFYVCIIIILVAVGGYAITQITSEERPRYDAEDLTPQKYKTSLENEKARLSQRIERGEAIEEEMEEKRASASDGRKTIIAKNGAVKSQTMESTVKAESQQAPKNSATDAQNVNDTSIEGRQSMGEIAPLPLMKENIMIHFTLNSNEIEPKSYEILNRIAAHLAQQTNKMVYIRGYTDASGSAGYNETVSRFRASAVKSYLVGKGASAENIVIFAMGSSNPIASNETAEGRRQNRRVEIEFPQSEPSTN